MGFIIGLVSKLFFNRLTGKCLPASGKFKISIFYERRETVLDKSEGRFVISIAQFREKERWGGGQ